MSTTIIPDAEVVDVAEVEPSIALVPAPRRGEVLKPLDLEQVKEAMTSYQQGMRELLVGDDWQGKPDTKGSFVKKSGWRKIATWFDLSIELLRDSVERDESGEVHRATVWARAVAPSGRFADGDGHCSADEKRFVEDKGRQKLENDLRGTAATRAVNRAISNLVGMGAVSAEEMPDPSLPQLGQPMDASLKAVVGDACVQICGGDLEQGKALFFAVKKDCDGYLPQAAALALIDAAEAVHRREHPEMLDALEVE